MNHSDTHDDSRPASMLPDADAPATSTSSGAASASPSGPAVELHGEIKDYRQPLVTSLGLILGFLLNYLAGWAEKSRNIGMFEDTTDVVIFGTILVAVTLLVYVLYRMLNPRLPEDPLMYYRTSLRLYLAGIIIAFSGFLLAWMV